MRGVVFTGDREVEMRALPDPRPGQSLLCLGIGAGTRGRNEPRSRRAGERGFRKPKCAAQKG